MKRRYGRWGMTLALVLASVLPAKAAPAAGAALRACAADLEYPPYLFSRRDGKDGPVTAQGLSADILQYALRKAGRSPAVIQRLPWLRCLKLAELGEFDVVLNVPTAQIDATPYLISASYAELHSIYFVSRRQRPNGIAIGNLQDLRSFRMCGLRGNRYESYGVQTSDVDTGANNYVSLINKLHVGRCDLVVEKSEVVSGLLALDPQLRVLLTSPMVRAMPLPEDSPIGLHFAVSRLKPDSAYLVGQLDAGISELRHTGKIKLWLADYLRFETASSKAAVSVARGRSRQAGQH